jgi:hypothetical protein
MGEWVKTEYGKRYKETTGTLYTAFFIAAPDENGKRNMPIEACKVILQWMLEEACKKQVQRQDIKASLP